MKNIEVIFSVKENPYSNSLKTMKTLHTKIFLCMVIVLIIYRDSRLEQKVALRALGLHFSGTRHQKQQLTLDQGWETAHNSHSLCNTAHSSRSRSFINPALCKRYFQWWSNRLVKKHKILLKISQIFENTEIQVRKPRKMFVLASFVAFFGHFLLFFDRNPSQNLNSLLKQPTQL